MAGPCHGFETRTARPLLTPGEVMQLPQDDALVLVSGTPPIRAKKLRYYEDDNFTLRCLPAPQLPDVGEYPDRPAPRGNDWHSQSRKVSRELKRQMFASTTVGGDGDEGGLRQEPDLFVGDADQRIEKPDIDTALLDDEFTIDTKTIDPLSRSQSNSQPIQRAHAINNGINNVDDRRADMLPDF